mgnify:CR=1 FL=1
MTPIAKSRRKAHASLEIEKFGVRSRNELIVLLR